MRRTMQASLAWSGILAAAVVGMLATGPVIAASPNVEAAVKTIAKISSDPAKFQAYCKLIQEMDEVSDQDAAKAEALEEQLDTLITSIGTDVSQAWELAADLDPASEDGKAFEAAFDALEDKCP